MIPAWPHGDPVDVARAIVADPRFTGSTSGERPAPSLIESVLQWLGDRLAALIGEIGHVVGANQRAGTAIGTAVIALTAVALVFAAVHVARGVRKGRRNRPLSARAGVARAADPIATSAEWLARARAAADAEHWRDAAAALFVAAMRALDERGRLPYDAARTAGEARRAIADPAFDVLAREGSVALFDDRGATRERYARMSDAYAHLFER